MAIQTECPHCQKPYRAADKMAGRRVRCRGCGGVFSLTAAVKSAGGGAPDDTHSGVKVDLPRGVNAASPSGDLAAGAAEAFRIPAAASPASPPSRRGSDTPSPHNGNPFDEPDLAGVDSDTVFTQAFQTYQPPVRSNHIHSFPYAYLIDRWTPPLLISVAVVWLILQIALGNESGVSWALGLRLPLAVVGFLLIVFPLGWLGMSVGCRWAKFSRPPSPAQRVIAATLFPYVLLVVIWLLVGSLGGAVPGVAVAMIVAVGLAWLLYRPTPEESPKTMIAAGMTFFFAVALCVGAVLGVNEAARAVARKSKPSPELVGSPIGPGLAWDHGAVPPVNPARPTVASVDPPPSTPVTPIAPATAPTTETQQTPPTQPRPDSPPIRPTSVLPPATRPAPPPATMASLPQDPFESSRLFGQGPSSTRPAATGTSHDPPMSSNVPPDVDPPVVSPEPHVPTGDALADRIAAAGSPLVAKVTAPKDVAPFERLIVSATPSPFALLVRPAAGTDGDALELWNLQSVTRVSSRNTPRDEQGDVITGNYALHPSGGLIARISAFPSLGVTFLSTGDAAIPERIAFPKTFGRPSLVGFADDGHLLVRWDDGARIGLQMLDVKRQSFGKGIDLPKSALLPTNHAVSPDGRLFAAVGESIGTDGQAQAELAVLDVQSGTSRRLPIRGVDPLWAASPTGVSFSLDSRKVAVLYERAGQAAVLWLAMEPRALPAASQPFRVIVPPAVGTIPLGDGVVPASGRLTSLQDGRAWLIGGNAVVDAETGKSIGVLGVPELLGSRGIDGAVAIIRDDDGPRRMILVHLARSFVGKATSRPAVPTTAPAFK